MRKEFRIPTTLSYDIKLEDWEMKQRYASGRVRSAGDFKFWKIVYEETDALIAKGGDKDVSILPIIYSTTLEMLQRSTTANLGNTRVRILSGEMEN